MFSSKNLQISKSRKVILPAISIKELKPVSMLLSPRDVLVSMFLVSVLAQIVDNLKGILSSKEIQQINSVKFYSKVISSGISCNSLTMLYSIAKTLGPELEIISSLGFVERVCFLKKLKTRLISELGAGVVKRKTYDLLDPVALSKYRRGIALQARSLMISTSLFSTHSLVSGISVKEIDLNVILDSARLFWNFLELEREEFDFLLRKESLICFKRCSANSLLSFPLSDIDSVRLILYDELARCSFFEKVLNFSDDLIIMHGENNLTRLEADLGFIIRDVPYLPDDIFVSQANLNDKILRASFDQRRDYKTKIMNMFHLASNSSRKSNKNERFKDFRLQKILRSNVNN